MKLHTAELNISQLPFSIEFFAFQMQHQKFTQDGFSLFSTVVMDFQKKEISKKGNFQNFF